MGPADFFGRKMVAELPENITIAIANISIGGQSILLFQPNVDVEAYLQEQKSWNTGFDIDWSRGCINEYGGDVYGRIVEMGRIAKEHGQIKGFLLHQGEADHPDQIKDIWPDKVKSAYDSLISDLDLDPTEVPLLVGELLYGGDMDWFNDANIARVPDVIPNAHVISAEGCSKEPTDTYNLHFSKEGYQILGERYADKMLELL